MRWKTSYGLIEMRITGIEENMFFRNLLLYPPTPHPGLKSKSICVGTFEFYNNEDLKEFEKLLSLNEITWKRDNSLMVVKNFYTARDVEALKYFKDKVIEYKKPVNVRNIIINTFYKNGDFMFKETLFNIYDIVLNTNTNTISFKYKLKELDN